MTDAVRASSDRRGSSSLGSSTNGSRRNGKRITAVKPTGRMLALARRSATSGRGKAAVNTPATTASLARQANPQLSGRDLAQTVRAHRSAAGAAGTRKAQATGRVRPGRERPVGGAEDQPWKVGLSETAQGQFVTGTRVGRSRSVTGDEPSVCREVTGTEYMGAEIFREFCQAEPPKPTPKVQVTTTGHGNAVTGNEVGRSSRVTGDEPGTCKTVTGTEYLSAEQTSAFCGTELQPNPRQTGQTQTTGGRPVSGVLPGLSAKVTGNEHGAGIQPTGSQYMSSANGDLSNLKKAPPKVDLTQTLRGGSVTGTRVGRSAKLTGDEPGSCRLVTGDEYVGAEQYKEFCGTQPPPLEAPKVGLSSTQKGLSVSGTQTGRSGRVTGDEPGTCKAVTGTPYAGLEQTATYCAPEQQRVIAERMRPMASVMAARMTGVRPRIGGVMTGASRGACEEISGTPYVGVDQIEETCGRAAQPGDSDFPQPLPESVEAAPWQSFSVASPARQAFQSRQDNAVTGTLYEQEGRITGPFGMGTGKITGTEQFRFDRGPSVPGNLLQMESAATMEADTAAARSRVTGEGQAAGTKITGDDWERGERVTGTEGPSARRRNPTRPGPMAAMGAVKPKRNEELPAPVSRVTGASGNTDRGSLITYSGGARG
ncbi:CsoS2 family carboxysome shell protein [Thiocapsa marina]|uniref:Carboxysome shell protein CsoS2 n=1 Tax=Thiocapsa marina 5811 TaxID=768671 RepID=F9UIH3_9GAMM|nr:CsoS2 family carboxysome shell protein [Thiocapsa marina]EGV15999.1 carboxysome shell protein CsoS2 [Thiocapsa marina 5811]